MKVEVSTDNANRLAKAACDAFFLEDDKVHATSEEKMIALGMIAGSVIVILIATEDE